MRIVYPAKVHQQETGPISRYAIRDLAWICREKLSQGKLWLTHNIGINHISTTVVRPLTYKEGHALCEGRGASMKEEQKAMENRTSTSVDLRQVQGINTDFGTLG